MIYTIMQIPQTKTRKRQQIFSDFDETSQTRRTRNLRAAYFYGSRILTLEQS